MTTFFLIVASTGLCCSVSRLTFSGKSELSTTPRTNRRYCGTSSSHSFWISTRLTYKSSPLLGGADIIHSIGLCCGTYISARNSVAPPSAATWIVSAGGSKSRASCL